MAKEKNEETRGDEKSAEQTDQKAPEVAKEISPEDLEQRRRFRRYDVCLANGSRLARLSIPRIPARVERQKMQRLAPNGQPVTEVVEVPIDVNAEMAADAIRAYNGSGPEATNYTAKQLSVVAVD